MQFSNIVQNRLCCSIALPAPLPPISFLLVLSVDGHNCRFAIQPKMRGKLILNVLCLPESLLGRCVVVMLAELPDQLAKVGSVLFGTNVTALGRQLYLIKNDQF
jgi:hypothetical protein